MLADLILTAGSLIFIGALVPSLRASTKPARSTSLLTSVVLLVFAITYVTIGLYFAAATTAITGLLWGILYLQAPKKRCVEEPFGPDDPVINEQREWTERTAQHERRMLGDERRMLGGLIAAGLTEDDDAVKYWRRRIAQIEMKPLYYRPESDD